MPDGWDDPKTLEVLTRRLELLRRLRESPAHKRDIIEDLDTSRSTLDRAVSEAPSVGSWPSLSSALTGRPAGRTRHRPAASGPLPVQSYS